MRPFTNITGILELDQKSIVLTIQLKLTATTGYVYKV